MNYGTINNIPGFASGSTAMNYGFDAQVQYYTWGVDTADSINGQNPITVGGGALPTWYFWAIYWNGSNWTFGASGL